MTTSFSEKSKMKKKTKKNPRIKIVFEPDSNFDKEFPEFIEEVLNWSKNKNEKSKNEKITK